MSLQPLFLKTIHLSYVYILKNIFFRFNPDRVHSGMVALGESMGKSSYSTIPVSLLMKTQSKALDQNVLGIHFKNPIGLSAGFDYEGRLTQILPAVGFGFETIGTITNMSYGGNPRPLLGRLPKSKSLMVNKGFKNLGAKETIRRLEGLDFHFPVGISIGRSNNKQCDTQKKSIQDILESFIAFENSRLHHAYYELNISCPNLFGNVTFYPPKNLKELLKEIDKLHLKKPLFIKMPIEKTNKEVEQMLQVITASSAKGVIFGNLLKDRKNKLLDRQELARFPMGNFSGKPTFERSNELIKLAYTLYKERLVVVGCGGVFNAQDAYTKISLGASLVQLITGMIYNGPQLISQINLDLVRLLKRDGFTHISQAIGHRA